MAGKKDGCILWIGLNLDAKSATDIRRQDPNAIQSLKRSDIESIHPSKVSMMPPGLVNMLKEDDILDLLAYLLSKGDAKHPFFRTK